MHYKIKKIALLLIIGVATDVVSAQVVHNKIGDNPFTLNKSAVLEVESLTKGFLPPRMTREQRNAIKEPAQGLQVWCTDCNFLTNPPSGQLCAYLGKGWVGFTMVTTPLLTTNTVTKGVANAITISGTLIDFSGDLPTETGVVWREIVGNDFATLPVLDDLANAIAPTHKIPTGTAVTKAGDLITITNFPLISTTEGKRPYYFRTYAKSSFGIGYGNPIIYNVAPPTLSTPVVSNGNTMTPAFAGTLTVNAGTPQGTITGYGYCSSMTNDKPTIADNKVALSTTPEGIVALATLEATLNSKNLTADPTINLAVNNYNFTNLGKTYFRYYVTTKDSPIVYGDVVDFDYVNPITGGTAVAEITRVDNLSAGVPLQLSVAGSGTIKVHFKVTKAGTYASFVPESKTGSTTGLTMSPAPAGHFDIGDDQTVTFTVSGTPETTTEGNIFTVSRISKPLSTGTPWWAIQAFTASCNGATPTTAVEIYSKTGKTWMDRNLGASRVAASYNDYKAQGCLYQWGRGNDDHASIKWTINTVSGIAPVNGTTTILSQGDVPKDAFFILPNSRWGDDWRSTFYSRSPDLWQGVKGVNNPCPFGYRVPTYAEFGSEIKAYSITNTATAYETFKFTKNSFRSSADGKLSDGSRAYYWTSTVSPTSSGRALAFSFDDSKVYSSDEESYAQGFSVRCIKGELEVQIPADMAVYTVTKIDPISNSFKMGQTSSNTIKVHFNVIKAGKYKTFAPESMSGATTGLSLATVLGGNFDVGSDQTLTFTISGTPATSVKGNSFEVPKLGTFETGAIQADEFVSGNITGGAATCDALHTTTVEAVYSNKTGRVWMDRNLGASQAATSIDDYKAYGCLFQWGRGNDGHASINWTSTILGTPVNSSTTKTLSDTDSPDYTTFITPWDDDSSYFDWRQPQNPKLWQGVNGINNPCPAGYRIPTIAEFEDESIAKSIQGAFDSPLKLIGMGIRYYADGRIINQSEGPTYWSSNVGSLTNGRNYTYKAAYRYRLGSVVPAKNGYGYSVRCIRDNPNEPVADGKAVFTVTRIDPISGSFKFGESSSGTIRVHLNVIKGGIYEGISTISPTGGATTGLVIQSIKSTVFNVEADKILDFTISGTPNNSTEGNYFVVPKIGTLSSGKVKGYEMRGSSAICDASHTTTVVEIRSKTGRIWMDRNLGASRAGIGNNYDYNAYGCIYQWGRGNDNHASIYWGQGGEPMNGTTFKKSTTDNPGNGLFITTSGNPSSDWRDPQNPKLWQGLDGINNPCPADYRIPTSQELTDEVNAYGLKNVADAIASPFRFVAAGNRWYDNGSIYDKALNIYIWSSTVDATGHSYYRMFTAAKTSDDYNIRSNAASVRCIKDKAENPVINDGGSGSIMALCDKSHQTTVNPVKSKSGATWMDRNLGASQAATSIDDYKAYGCLFQWGRGNDGHASINWFSSPVGRAVNGVTNTKPITGDALEDALFINGGSSATDAQWWQTTPNPKLWQGVSGINNPCPSGYRVPTFAEFETEETAYGITNEAKAYESPLKFTKNGFRNNDGRVSKGGLAFYWSSTKMGVNYVAFAPKESAVYGSLSGSAYGFSVRCIKN